VVTHRPQRPARTGAHEVLGEQRDDRHQRPHEPEVALVARVVLARDLERAQVDRADGGLRADGRAVVAAGDVPQVPPQVLPDEDQPEGDDRQVVAAQPQRERPDQPAEHGPDRGGGEQPHEQRQSEVTADDRRRVRARADEERVAERDLPAVAGEQVEPDRADGGDAGVDQDRQPEVVLHHGRQDQERDEHEREARLGHGRAEQAQILLIRPDQIAVRFAHMRLTSLVPSNPYGRISRITIMSR
jgi:hypothetical protein